MEHPGSPRVEILLATRNGERFLRPQLDSLLAQDYPNLHILARDDGSTDSTRRILTAYRDLHPDRIDILPDHEPTGSAKGNFARLFAASTAPYACPCDQDDVWLPEKISRSMAAMQRLEAAQGANTPLLVFSDLRVVDDQLNPLHASFWAQQQIHPERIHQLRRLLTQNVVTGCTVLANRPLVTLAQDMPTDAYMHDWWLALLAAAFGAAESLAEPTVLYRQHTQNTIGVTEPEPTNLLPRLRFHTLRRRQWEMTERQAEAMLRVHRSTLPPTACRLLAAYIRCETSPSRLVRVATLLRHGFFRTGLRENLAILWYLWDKDAATHVKQRAPQPTGRPSA